jgi:hypothetical protein
MRDLSLPEFVASALAYTFIQRYGGQDGNGLFEGIERYRRLEERFQQSAVQAGSLFTLWGHVCRTMMVSGAVGAVADPAVRIITVPSALGQMVLRVLAETPAPVVMVARLWAETERNQSERYAEKAGRNVASAGTVVLSYRADSLVRGGDYVTVQVPEYSANSLRHELVREPLLWHLYHRMGIPFDGPLGARTALFYNGGDLKRAGSAGIFWARKDIRNLYPSLALLGGSTDTFMLGESNLRVHCWLRCSENNRSLSQVGMQSDASAFDLLDRITLTRHSSRLAGQDGVQTAMPFTFEALVPGAEIIARLGLVTYAQPIEEGALAAAVATFRELDMTLGGQGARGYGHVALDWLDGEPGRQDEYESHLEAHADAIRSGIMDGTMGTGSVVVSE